MRVRSLGRRRTNPQSATASPASTFAAHYRPGQPVNQLWPAPPKLTGLQPELSSTLSLVDLMLPNTADPSLTQGCTRQKYLHLNTNHQTSYHLSPNNDFEKVPFSRLSARISERKFPHMEGEQADNRGSSVQWWYKMHDAIWNSSTPLCEHSLVLQQL